MHCSRKLDWGMHRHGRKTDVVNLSDVLPVSPVPVRQMRVGNRKSRNGNLELK